MDPAAIGPYSIEKKLGSGGMGTVYLGHHVETGNEVAVKVLPASMAKEEGFRARFTREIETVQKFASPHVVRFFESGVHEETLYYAMEYVDGETLTDRLKRERRLSWREVVDMSVQICSALKAAHDAGIVHRDLKPSNLLIQNDGTVKLTDFGVAQVFAGTKLTVTGGVIGTAEYMSPEQANGSRATPKSDLYALGAVMYAMLTGRPPFLGKTTIDLIHKHRFGQFDRPHMFVPEIPHWLDEVVCQLLEKDPAKRPPDAFVLSRRLQEVVQKVEYSAQQETLAAQHITGGDETATANAVDDGTGAGTLMRELVRAEIERSQKASALAGFLNNTWVLLGLLALLIAGGVWWFTAGELTAEEKFRAGIEVLRGAEGPEWIEAREKYFKPLVENDPETWQEKVEPYLRRIELYELKRPAVRRLGSLRKETAGSDEPVRLLQLAQHYREIGEVDRARQTLLALVVLWADVEEFQRERELAQQMLKEMDKGTGDSERKALVKSALDRAMQAAQNGDHQQARRICDSLIVLYGLDPAVRRVVDEARNRFLKAGQRPSD